ncbi:MAG: hypothetical protein JO025_27015 [Verrucomicrobia bacterium]|nr:hypothetical protein [Verrucomicrobiota bacterium]
MTKARAQEHLDAADRSLKGAKPRIREQEERVQKLARNGHETENSEAFLITFKDLEVTMVKHRDLVRSELNKAEFHLITRPR